MRNRLKVTRDFCAGIGIVVARATQHCCVLLRGGAEGELARTADFSQCAAVSGSVRIGALGGVCVCVRGCFRDSRHFDYVFGATRWITVI